MRPARVPVITAVLLIATAPAALAAPDSLASPGALARAGGMIRNFASDAWYIASAPARSKRAGILFPLAAAGATAALYSLDEDISSAVKRNEDVPLVDAAVYAGEGLEGIGYPGRTFPYYIGGTLIGAAFRIEPVQRAGLDILETQLLSGSIRNVLSMVIGRRRPHEGFGSHRFEWNGGTSFPSGHTSSAFQLAAILSHHADWTPLTVALYTAAGTVAIQRLDSDSHWASDVFLSAVEGTLTARTVVRRNEERRGTARAARVGVVSGGRSVALRVTF